MAATPPALQKPPRGMTLVEVSEWADTMNQQADELERFAHQLRHQANRMLLEVQHALTPKATPPG